MLFLKFLLLTTLISIASCTQESAKIINRNNIKFNKNNQSNQEKYRNLAQNKAKSTEAKTTNSQKTNQVVVAEGDTLYSITKKHGVTLRELIDHNNIEPPYQVKVGDVVKIPGANYHESREGDTLYSISRLYGMKVSDLISLNNLKFPYPIYPGDKIKITNSKNGDNSGNVASKEVVKNVDKNGDLKKFVDSKPNPETTYVVRDVMQAKNLSLQNSQENSPEKIKEKIKNIQANQPLKPSNTTSQNNLVANKVANENTNNLAVNKPIDKNYNKKIIDKNNQFQWPVRGEVISRFGPKSAGLYNDGINIKAKEGQAVTASEDGVVAYVGNELKGYGNLIIIKHAEGWISAYAHLKDSAVNRGQSIKRGAKIGTVGNSGKVNSPQLYFGLRKGRDAVNPENYLNFRN